ncbi:MAG: hypothetical protein ACOCXH_11180 [Cyclobacteriaceae bacterium]
MKKVRLLKFLFLLVISGFVFSSCSDEEEVQSPTLTGFWELKTQEVRNANQEINGFYNSTWGLRIPSLGDIIIPILSNQIEFFNENSEFVNTLNTFNGVSFIEIGTYELSEDNTKLTLSYNSSDVEYEFELELNQMFLTQEETFDYNDDNDENTPPVQVTGEITYRFVKIY